MNFDSFGHLKSSWSRVCAAFCFVSFAKSALSVAFLRETCLDGEIVVLLVNFSGFEYQKRR